jgi:hypothetical protein
MNIDRGFAPLSTVPAPRHSKERLGRTAAVKSLKQKRKAKQNKIKLRKHEGIKEGCFCDHCHESVLWHT